MVLRKSSQTVFKRYLRPERIHAEAAVGTMRSRKPNRPPLMKKSWNGASQIVANRLQTILTSGTNSCGSGGWNDEVSQTKQAATDEEILEWCFANRRKPSSNDTY